MRSTKRRPGASFSTYWPSRNATPSRYQNKEGLMRLIALWHTLWGGMISTLIILALNIGLNLATHTGAGDIVALVYFGLYGLYCLQNYLRCREYHCMITGPGFLLAAILMLLRVTGLFDRGFGIPYLVFALAALIGHGLE